MKKQRTLRARRDVFDRPRAPATVMSTLLHRLVTLDSKVSGFRSGPEVYISLKNIENAYVLADALEEHGYRKLANKLSSFARGIEREKHRKRLEIPIDTGEFGPYRSRWELEPIRKEQSTTTPSWKKWRSLTQAIRHAIHEIREEQYRGAPRNVRWWQRRVSGAPWADLYAIPVRVIQPMDAEGFTIVVPYLGPRKGRTTAVPESLLLDKPTKSLKLFRGSSQYLKR